MGNGLQVRYGSFLANLLLIILTNGVVSCDSRSGGLR
jgi:hypothetical protein